MPVCAVDLYSVIGGDIKPLRGSASRVVDLPQSDLSILHVDGPIAKSCGGVVFASPETRALLRTKQEGFLFYISEGKLQNIPAVVLDYTEGTSPTIRPKTAGDFFSGLSGSVLKIDGEDTALLLRRNMIEEDKAGGEVWETMSLDLAMKMTDGYFEGNGSEHWLKPPTSCAGTTQRKPDLQDKFRIWQHNGRTLSASSIDVILSHESGKCWVSELPSNEPLFLEFEINHENFDAIDEIIVSASQLSSDIQPTWIEFLISSKQTPEWNSIGSVNSVNGEYRKHMIKDFPAKYMRLEFHVQPKARETGICTISFINKTN